MAILITPTSFAMERWMKVDGVSGLTLFTWSGVANFGPDVPNEPVTNESLVAVGSNDSEDQLTYVGYDVEMIVGPHWVTVRQLCPTVWAAGHDQTSPDEADGMGYEVGPIAKVELVTVQGIKRIKMRLACKVAGGFDTDPAAWGRVPALAYQVSALGRLASPAGNEGSFFSMS
jgi:hypothetical protein